MSDTPSLTRAVVLAARPHGEPTSENFRIQEITVPDLRAGQVLVENTVMSVDPYMRGRMNDAESYVPPFALDEPLQGHAVGEVVASRSDQVPQGSIVTHMAGWREHAVVPADQVTLVDTDRAEDAAYLGVLGMPGLTAYAGLFAVAAFQPGDAVFVSGAAGAVGSAVGQMARLAGASRVIGSAGSPQKVARLGELGFDAAINYREGNLAGQLQEAAPEGIDVYFDNVGGEHLEAALDVFNLGGRAAICGMISQYNATEPSAAPRNLGLLIGKRARLQGFLVADHENLRGEFYERVTDWLASGQLQFDTTERQGLDEAPGAFLELFSGANTGKMVVRL